MFENKNGLNAPLNTTLSIISKDFKKLNKIQGKDAKMFDIEWLIPNFLLKGTLVMVYARAGSGKSWWAYCLANHILNAENSIDEVFYLDADNGLVTLKNRGVDRLLENERINYKLLNGAEHCDIFKSLKTYDFSKKLIIIDSIRDFMSHVNFNSDKEVTAYLQDLKVLRDNGATIVFLHHQQKQTDGENNKQYKGSTAFIDSVDEAYWLDNIGENNKFLLYFEPQKCRDETKPKVFVLDTANFDFKILEDKEVKMLGLIDIERITLELACEVINSHEKINQGNLAKKIKALANDRAFDIVGNNSLWRLLKKFDRILFKISKGGYNRKELIFTSLS
ncbi:MAG: AAA family ATPase [Campylobacter sp.]|nr:AAA family ATPase [Campylobacter sp.]